jgi:hypothetical protein
MLELASLVRMIVVAVLLLSGAVAPALACPEMAMPVMAVMTVMTTTPDTDRPAAPPAASSCDMACLACLVQPAPLRFGAHGGWSRTAHYLPAAVQLSECSTPPELPPPRYLPL